MRERREKERREAVSVVVGGGVVVDDGDSDVNAMQRFNLLVLRFLLFCIHLCVCALLKKPRNSESVVNVENQKVFKVCCKLRIFGNASCFLKLVADGSTFETF